MSKQLLFGEKSRVLLLSISLPRKLSDNRAKFRRGHSFLSLTFPFYRSPTENKEEKKKRAEEISQANTLPGACELISKRMILFQALISRRYNSKSISTAFHQLYLWESCDLFIGKTVPRVQLFCFQKITRHQKMPGIVPDNEAISARRPQQFCLNASACSKTTKWSQRRVDPPPVRDTSAKSMILNCAGMGDPGVSGSR